MDVKDSMPWNPEGVLLLCLDPDAGEGNLEEVIARLTPSGGSLRQRLSILFLYRHLLT